MPIDSHPATMRHWTTAVVAPGERERSGCARTASAGFRRDSVQRARDVHRSPRWTQPAGFRMGVMSAYPKFRQRAGRGSAAGRRRERPRSRRCSDRRRPAHRSLHDLPTRAPKPLLSRLCPTRRTPNWGGPTEHARFSVAYIAVHIPSPRGWMHSTRTEAASSSPYLLQVFPHQPSINSAILRSSESRLLLHDCRTASRNTRMSLSPNWKTSIPDPVSSSSFDSSSSSR